MKEFVKVIFNLEPKSLNALKMALKSYKPAKNIMSDLLGIIEYCEKENKEFYE